ncbi:MAG: hypothetical protein ACRD06_03680 [Terriglobia bacterium]
MKSHTATGKSAAERGGFTPDTGSDGEVAIIVDRAEICCLQHAPLPPEVRQADPIARQHSAISAGVVKRPPHWNAGARKATPTKKTRNPLARCSQWHMHNFLP